MPCIPPPSSPRHGGLSRRSIGFPLPGSGSGHHQPHGSPRHWQRGAPAGAQRCRCGSGGPGHLPGGGRVQGWGQRGPRPPPQQVVGPVGRRVLCCRSSAGVAGRPGSPAAATRGLVGGQHLQGRQKLDPSSAAWGLRPHPPSLAPFHTHSLPCSLSPSLTLSFPNPLLGCCEPHQAPQTPLLLSCLSQGTDTQSWGHTGHPSTALLLRGPPCPPSMG